jgi:hypothetical protein
MTPRTVLALMLVLVGLGLSALFLTREAHSLRAALDRTQTNAHPRARSDSGPQPSNRDRARRRTRPRIDSEAAAQRRHAAGRASVFEIIGIEIAAGMALTGGLVIGLLARRLWRRRTREYRLYELRLSTHDQAKPQDLEDMVEAIANIVRAWPAERLRHGQPYVALELLCGTVPTTGGSLEMEWSINVRCEPRVVGALDGAISAAYPDVRLGHFHGEPPRPRGGVLRRAGCLMRFRKQRSFVYSLIADGEEQASSPLEQVARAQVATGSPSLVRIQLTPTPASFEELARRMYRRHENKLVRQDRWGLPEGGLMSTFNRAEMRAAERTQNRSLFWLELVVAADTREACKSVAAAVQSRRGENRLHRRWMLVGGGLYYRRFPRALPPVVPSFRSLVSAAEVAHLFALPSARMKGVPVRRVTLPRIPAPPEVTRGTRSRTVSIPASATDPTKHASRGAHGRRVTAGSVHRG